MAYDEPSCELDALRLRAGELAAQRDDQRAFARALIRDLKEHARIVSVFSHMLLDGQLSPGNEREGLRFIREAGDHMSRLAEASVQYAQLYDLDTVAKERFWLNDALEAAKANLAEALRARGAIIHSDILPTVQASAPHMVQLFENLLANAIAHGKDGVRIEINAQRDRDVWRIVVQDDGPGIAPEHQERIFEPFKRLSEDESRIGLGLPVCARITELHGGEITCQSALGQGAAFCFTLPVMAEEARDARVNAANAPIATVLLVDDREPNIRLARMFLGEPVGMCCEFIVANDGEAGLAAINARLKDGAGVDLVLLDINMPVMDGFEMLEQMRANEAMRSIPVVMCSGSSYDKDKARAADLGAIGYLEKPPRFEKLRPILDLAHSVRLVSNGGGPPMLLRVA